MKEPTEAKKKTIEPVTGKMAVNLSEQSIASKKAAHDMKVAQFLAGGKY